jgi:Ni,Fe-hydrogenase maturation factor
MRILVFGNPIVAADSLAIKVAHALQKELPEVQFVHFDTMEDLEKEGPNIIVLDVAKGIRKTALLSASDLELQRIHSLHDFDLGWTLALLAKLGKIKKAQIIALPYGASAAECKSDAKKIIEKLGRAAKPSSRAANGSAPKKKEKKALKP